MTQKQKTQPKKALTKLGLSDKEMAVYLALLETGPSTVSPISKKADIKRSSIYNFISHLIEIGLVSVYVKNNRHYYCAENPEYLNQLADEQKEQIKKAVPILSNIYKTKDYHPATKMFYGLEGMKKALYDVFNCKDKKLYFIIDINSAINNMGLKFWNSYVDQLIEKGITSHSLRHGEQKKRIPKYKYQTKTQYKETTIIPRYLPEHVKISNTMGIYDNKVIILSPPEENWAMLVESKSYANSMKSFHEALWRMSKQSTQH